MLARTPARKPELTRLALEAGNDIKAGKLNEASEVLARLAAALDAPADQRPNGASDWAAARKAWQDANDAVNDQITALRSVLLNRVKSDDDDDIDDYADELMDIAENGLNAVTEDHRVKLMAAVMELGAGPSPAMGASGTKALGHIQAFQAFLAGSAKIAVCDGNPFGAPVSIRATLDPALQQMALALQAATGG